MTVIASGDLKAHKIYIVGIFFQIHKNENYLYF